MTEETAESASVTYRCSNGHEFDRRNGNEHAREGYQFQRFCPICQDKQNCQVVDA